MEKGITSQGLQMNSKPNINIKPKPNRKVMLGSGLRLGYGKSYG